MLVRSRMTPDPITVTPQTTLGEALGTVREQNIRHLPVLEGGRLLGIVTDRDLRLAAPPAWASGTDYDELRTMFEQKTVADVMTSHATIIGTTEDTPIEDAAQLLYQHRVGCVPVMRGEQLVGILTETDVMRAFVELFSTGEDERRIEVRIPNKPGELSRVVRAIGVDHKMNITGIVVPPIKGADSVAIMHVQSRDVEELVEHLRMLGYQVGSPSLDLEPEGTHDARKPLRVRHWAGDGF